MLWPLRVHSTTLCICSHVISAVISMSHFVVCLLYLCLSSMAWRVWPLGLVMFPLISLQAWTLVWQKSLPIQSVGLLPLLLIYLLCLWTCWPSFLSCWSIGFFISFLGLSWPIYFTFTSCCAHGFVGCHFYHVCPLSFLALFVGFHGPFTLLLPLVVPMGLLAVIPTMLAH